MTQKITLIRGDGIGPEICESVLDIFKAAEVDLEWEETEAGLSAFEKTGVAIGPEALEVIRKNQVALKGPTTTPVGKGHRSINVNIRKTLDLYVNVRPCYSIPALKGRYENVDIIVVRENIEDTYGGIEYRQSEDLGVGLRLSTRSGALRAHEYAFQTALKQNRKRVTCVHKANIMKITDGLWLEAFRETAAKYPQIQADDIIVDNCCMQLVSKPEQFDVLVLPNLFGDIVSDLCAGLIGGLGIASGANIGSNCAVFEAVHGSAPDIAGKGWANPTALLFSSLAMLNHIDMPEKSDLIRRALRTALRDPQARTRDLGGTGDTKTFTQKVIDSLGAQ